MTKSTFSIVVTSARGVAGDGYDVGEFSGLDCSQRILRMPSNSAAVTVAERIAWAGVMPNFTIEENSFAGFTFQSKPPASVPKAIFTPAFMARRNVSS